MYATQGRSVDNITRLISTICSCSVDPATPVSGGDQLRVDSSVQNWLHSYFQLVKVNPFSHFPGLCTQLTSPHIDFKASRPEILLL